MLRVVALEVAVLPGVVEHHQNRHDLAQAQARPAIAPGRWHGQQFLRRLQGELAAEIVNVAKHCGQIHGKLLMSGMMCGNINPHRLSRGSHLSKTHVNADNLLV